MSGTALAGLEEELAFSGVARETARRRLDPEHVAANVLALDLRAEALRVRIAALMPRLNMAEPVELRRGGGALLVSGG
jgi:hypothetical protein